LGASTRGGKISEKSNRTSLKWFLGNGGEKHLKKNIIQLEKDAWR